MGLLTGKAALITGGGAGIGRGIARRFAREGAAVMIAEIDAANGAAAARELRDELGGEADAIVADVRDRAAVEGAVAATIQRFGGIDILVNNAFTLSPNILLEHKTDDMLDSTLNAGLWACWWAMRAALPSMKARGGGAVVNFYSIDAEVAAWLHADYNITKSAILGLTRSAAAEWGRFNIRVNAIAPTAMGTVFHQLAQKFPGFAESAAARKPLGRNGDPEEDIGPVVVFLASEMARYVTGELIHVDGGLHLPGYDSRPQNLAELEGR
jgi:NAD(P)-dependent dehydrogenase (short-subunit alcohol dehydrogenase family)